MFTSTDRPDDQFSVYCLDTMWEGRTFIGKLGTEEHAKSTDGVVVAWLGGSSTVVCFIDLKGKMGTDEQIAHGVAQMTQSVEHFAPGGSGPGGTAHGAEHHESWRKPSKKKPPDELLHGHPDAEHIVGGVFIMNRELPRALPPLGTFAGKLVRVASVRVDHKGAPNTGEIDVLDLCRRARLI